MRQISCRSKATLATAVMLVGMETRAEQNPASQADNPGQLPVRRIVISLTECKLALLENGVVAKIYHVAVGAPASPSPVGIYEIANRIELPTYYAPGKIIAPGLDNPLGTRWIGISIKGFGIHGTNRPKSIGKAASHGCIRLRNRDVEELFRIVREGDVVELHAQSSEELAGIFAANPPAASGQASRAGTVITPASR